MSKLRIDIIVDNFENILWYKLNKYFGKHKKDYQFNRHVDQICRELKNIDVFHKKYIKETAEITSNTESNHMASFLIKELISSSLTLGKLLIAIYFITKLCKRYIRLNKIERIEKIIAEAKQLINEYSPRYSVQLANLNSVPLQYGLITCCIWIICSSIYFTF